MTPGPAWSVVMPLYNKRETVAAAVGSVLAQTEPDLELIVVDDGSTDDSAAAALAAADPRVLLLRQENRGVAAARNRGVAAASAPIVAFLDADDLWDPDFLETVRGLVRDFPECAVFATSYRIAGPDGSVRRATLRGPGTGGERFVLGEYFGVAALSDPPLWTSAVALRREALAGVGGFPEGVDSGEDLLTWARLAARYKVAYCAGAKAVFHPPATVAERRARLPREDDPVGAALAAIEQDVAPPRRPQVRAYRALWHRMRASRFLQAGDSRLARAEARRALALGGRGPTLALGAVSLLPGWLARPAFALLRRAAQRVRG